MAPSSEDRPSRKTILREVSAVLRDNHDPWQLTFKQVRLDVEQSLGLQKGSLKESSCKAMIKEAVHTVMDEIDSEVAAKAKEAASEAKEEEEEEEEEEETEDEDEIEEEEEDEAEFEGAWRFVRSSVSAAAAAVPTDASDGESAPARGPKERESVPAATESAVAPKRKRKKKAEVSKISKEDKGRGVVCVVGEIANGRKQVSVEKFKGHLLVNIREHYRDARGKYQPGKKGIALNRQQWQALTSASAIEHIDRALNSEKMTS
eukprot:g16018.t1